MQGLTVHGNGAGSQGGSPPPTQGSRSVSNSRGGVRHGPHISCPPSEGSLQSLCPAKFVAFTWLIQSHTVVEPLTTQSASTAQVLHGVPLASCAAHVAAAAAFGWHKLDPLLAQVPPQQPAHP